MSKNPVRHNTYHLIDQTLNTPWLIQTQPVDIQHNISVVSDNALTPDRRAAQVC
jgi:hypothetical protein